MLNVEAGDFSDLATAVPSGGWDKSLFMAQTMGRLKYDAWTPGERELFFGQASLSQLVEGLRAEIVSANVKGPDGKAIFKDSIVKTLGRTKIGITGVTSKTVFASVASEQNRGMKDFTFDDPFESLKPVVARLRGQVDVVLVLAHVGPGDARQMAEEVPGIDVIVVGHNPGYMYNPDRVGDVLLVRNGNRGQYAAKLTLTLDGNGKIADYKGQAEPLNEGVVVDPAISSDVQKFSDALAKKQAEEARKAAVAQVNEKGGEKYLGDEICARCHSDVYTQWARGPHAHAFQTLATKNSQKDKNCLSCHVTGFGDPTGYQTLVYKDGGGGKVDTTDSVELRNVQCESCHGKGTLHGVAPFVTKVPKEVCTPCHDAKNDPKFDYDKAIAAKTYH